MHSTREINKFKGEYKLEEQASFGIINSFFRFFNFLGNHTQERSGLTPASALTDPF